MHKALATLTHSGNVVISASKRQDVLGCTGHLYENRTGSAVSEVDGKPCDVRIVQLWIVKGVGQGCRLTFRHERISIAHGQDNDRRLEVPEAVDATLHQHCLGNCLVRGVSKCWKARREIEVLQSTQQPCSIVDVVVEVEKHRSSVAVGHCSHTNGIWPDQLTQAFDNARCEATD